MKKIISIFISFFVIYTPTFVFAGAAEQWTIEKVVYDDVGKSLTYTASRPNAFASNDYVYKAKVGVDAARTGSTAASMIRFGLASAAIIAIVEGVGWVIEDGSVVKKNDPLGVPESIYIEAPAYGFDSTKTFTTKNSAVSAFLLKYLGHSNFTLGSHTLYSTVKLPNNKKKVIYTSAYKHGTVNTSTRVLVVIHGNVLPETVPVSDLELGQAIIDSPSAPTVIPDIYSPDNPVPRPSPAPDAVQTALDTANPQPRENPKTDIKNKPNKDTDADGVLDEYDPTLPNNGFEFELPEFCSWAATVCEWYVRYKDDSDLVKEHREKELTFWEKVEDWFNWTKDDSNLPDDESPEISQLPIPELEENAVSWSAQCPNDVDIPINLQGVSSTITFSWSPWCQLLSMIKPAIVASAYIGAAFIVLGLRT